MEWHRPLRVALQMVEQVATRDDRAVLTQELESLIGMMEHKISTVTERARSLWGCRSPALRACPPLCHHATCTDRLRRRFKPSSYGVTYIRLPTDFGISCIQSACRGHAAFVSTQHHECCVSPTVFHTGHSEEWCFV